MNDIKSLTDLVVSFREERDWKQFHNPKDLALSLVLESAEVLEHFQWKNGDVLMQHTIAGKDEIGKEIADVFAYLLLLSNELNIDIAEALKNKMQENAKRYPVDLSRGNAKKYTSL